MAHRKAKITTGKIRYLILVCVLLTGCDKLFIAPNNDFQEQNIRDFEEIWSFIDANYPFFEFMEINSEYLYEKYRPLAEQSRGDEIFGVVLNMLAELKDGHTIFKNEAAGIVDMIPYIMPRMKRDYNRFSPTVTRKYFSTELFVNGEKNLEYGITDDNTGYIRISSFTELHSDPRDFDHALDYLRNTDALILDLRHNSGGEITRIAERFVTSTIRIIYYDKYGDSEEEIINPRGTFIYTKPVVILINGCSVSGAEFLAAHLQPLPNVTLVGDTTAGLGGSDTEITLSSGKWLSTTRVYSYYYDRLIQWNGVPPDILVRNTEEEIRRNRDNQLEFALDYLTGR
ncbi:MAG: S41 family peptidase [Bacteroidales bacterium]|jgi:C-terminal processing protease CtpA/Prc